MADLVEAVGEGCLNAWADGRRRGALHYAAQHGRTKTCEWLLGRGARPLARDADGRAPLHLAAGEGHELVSCTDTRGRCIFS